MKYVQVNIAGYSTLRVGINKCTWLDLSEIAVMKNNEMKFQK